MLFISFLASGFSSCSLLFSFFIYFLSFSLSFVSPQGLLTAMDSTEPTQKEHDSSAPEMARVPFVGRLHLYFPLPTKSFPYFSAPASKSPGAAALDGTVPTPPLTPPVSEPEKELEEIEPREYEEVAAVAGVAPSPSKKAASDPDDSAEANAGPFMERNSQEYLALAFSFLFLVIERFLRIITIALREFFGLFSYIYIYFLFFLLSQPYLFPVVRGGRRGALCLLPWNADSYLQLLP